MPRLLGATSAPSHLNRAISTPFTPPAGRRNCPATDPGGGWALLQTNKDTIIKTLLCPADPNSPKTNTHDTNVVADGSTQMQGLHTNYVVCGGSAALRQRPESQRHLLRQVIRRALTDITDGLSNTLMASEICVVPDTTANDLRGRYSNSWEGNNWFSTVHPPNSRLPDVQQYQGQTIPQAPMTNTGSRAVRAARQLTAQLSHRVRSTPCWPTAPPAASATASTPLIYQQLGTRAGGEPATSY